MRRVDGQQRRVRRGGHRQRERGQQNHPGEHAEHLAALFGVERDPLGPVRVLVLEVLEKRRLLLGPACALLLFAVVMVCRKELQNNSRE